MAEEALQTLLDVTPGVDALLVTDRDGVELSKVVREGVQRQGFCSGSECLAATFAVAQSQASKLSLGECNHICCFFDTNILVHIGVPPLVVSAVAASDANVGAIIAAKADLAQVLEPIRRSVVTLEARESQQ